MVGETRTDESPCESPGLVSADHTYTITTRVENGGFTVSLFGVVIKEREDRRHRKTYRHTDCAATMPESRKDLRASSLQHAPLETARLVQFPTMSKTEHPCRLSVSPPRSATRKWNWPAAKCRMRSRGLVKTHTTHTTSDAAPVRLYG